MKKISIFLIIIISVLINPVITRANTQPAPASPVCEFHGVITETLNRSMVPTDKIDEIEGFSIKILNIRYLLRGDVQAYPTADCSGEIRRNSVVKRWMSDQYTSDGNKKYSTENFKVGQRLSGSMDLFESGIYNLSFYPNPAITKIQEGGFYTISQLKSMFWAPESGTTFSSEGYFMGIDEGYLMGEGWMEIDYSAIFTEISIDIEALVELERKIEEYPPYMRDEKISLYTRGRDINIPSRYNTIHLNIDELEAEKLRTELKVGEKYALDIKYSGGGEGYELVSYKLKTESTDSDKKDPDNKITKPIPENSEEESNNEKEDNNEENEEETEEDDKLQEPKERKSIFSKIRSFMMSLFNFRKS